jgi:putative endonuclease
MAKNKRKVGEKAEQWAADYLKAKGYDIIHRNLQVGHLEIDLIALAEDWLIFVEVKMREDQEHGLPEEKVNFTKQSYLIKAADLYLNEHPWPGKLRFDLIAITLKPFEIIHFEDAFY